MPPGIKKAARERIKLDRELKELYPSLRTMTEMEDIEKQRDYVNTLKNKDFSTLCNCIEKFINKDRPFKIPAAQSKRVSKILTPYKIPLKQFTKKRLSVKKKRELYKQTGRGVVIPLLLSALAPVITELVGQFIGRKKK